MVAENALDVAAESGHWVILQVGRPPQPPAPAAERASHRTGTRGLGGAHSKLGSVQVGRVARGVRGVRGVRAARGQRGFFRGEKDPGLDAGEPLRRYHLKHRSTGAKSTPSRCPAVGGGALATFRANPSTAPSWVLQPPSARPPPGLSHKHLQATQLPQAPRCGRPQSAGVTWPGVESSASRHFFLS